MKEGNMGFITHRGTKKIVEEQMEELKTKAKKQYPNIYKETSNGFEIKGRDINISFSIDKFFIGEYAIYQIFY